jgi:hypothetical protein
MRASAGEALGCELGRGKGGAEGRKVLEMGEAIAKEGLNVATLSGKALKEPQRLGSSPVEMAQGHFVAERVTVG